MNFLYDVSESYHEIQDANCLEEFADTLPEGEVQFDDTPEEVTVSVATIEPCTLYYE